MYTSEKVKRFDFTVLGEGALLRFEDKDGHYIHCADYEAAERRIAELTKERDPWRQAHHACDKENLKLEAEVKDLGALLQAAMEALEKISNPIGYLQKRASEKGCLLDGKVAIDLARDVGWLRGIATAALKQRGRT